VELGLPDGFHVWAYLGNDRWIEADPTPGKVVTISTAEKARQWEDTPVRLVLAAADIHRHSEVPVHRRLNLAFIKPLPRRF
jgi:hypothetical protein